MLRDRESEVAALRDKVRFLEDELTKLKSDIVVSGQRADAAEKETADLWTEVEGLRLKLHTVEEEKMEALNSDKNTSSEIETLNEQKNQLADELEASKDELEKIKKAMEGLASALQEMSAESREAQEKYLLKQGGAGLHSNGLHSTKENSGRASPTKQHQQYKKKPLLKRFGGLLKKKTEN